jgi:hypothetical protein
MARCRVNRPTGAGSLTSERIVAIGAPVAVALADASP